MKRNYLCVAVSMMVILALAPRSRADKANTVAKPDDLTVSLDLKFTKKKANAMERILSFLDYGPNGFATGFIVGNGLVMTAYHAVSGNLSDSKKVQLGFSPNDELAVEIQVRLSAKVIKVDGLRTWRCSGFVIRNELRPRVSNDPDQNEGCSSLC